MILLFQMAFFAVTSELDDVSECQEIPLFGNATEQLFEFWVYDVDTDAAVLARGMVVVWCKDFAEFDLAFKSVPDPVNDPESFKERDRAVGCGTVDGWCTCTG